MITLEKIIELDDKINRAVKVIESLREENNLLKQKISGYRNKISRLEELVSSFKDDQDEIEAGIRNAVDTLNQMLNQAVEELQNNSTAASGLESEPATTPAELPLASPEPKEAEPADNQQQETKPQEMTAEAETVEEELSEAELEKLTQPAESETAAVEPGFSEEEMTESAAAETALTEDEATVEADSSPEEETAVPLDGELDIF